MVPEAPGCAGCSSLCTKACGIYEIATVAGGIAEAFYGLPKDLETQIFDYLTDDLAEVVERFCLYKKEKNNEKR